MNNKPTYGLKRIAVEDFRGIKKTEVDNIPADTSWIFLTGNNGYGKTSFLQTIFIGLFGNIDESTILEKNKFHVISELHNESRGTPTHRSITENWTDVNKEFHTVVAYGSSRLGVQADGNKSETEGRSSTSYSLFYSDGVLLNIENELKSWHYRSTVHKISKGLQSKLSNKYEHVRRILTQLMPGIKAIEVNPETDRIEYFETAANNGTLGNATPFNQLASGYRSVIAMVGDMIIRLFKTQPDIDNPADLEGIVLIDELDVHLHPSWQKKLPGLLSSAFPKVQFIASTHSPIPFLGAPKNSVFLKVNRTAEEGITVEIIEEDISDWTPNLILSSPIFGFSEILQTEHNTDA
ncbi:MAG: putative ATP-binding protein involved in virulence, partial [Saprospiraceae bacterium]